MPFSDDYNHPLSEHNFDRLLDEAIKEMLSAEDEQNKLEESGFDIDTLKREVKKDSENLLKSVKSVSDKYDSTSDKIKVIKQNPLYANSVKDYLNFRSRISLLEINASVRAREYALEIFFLILIIVPYILHII